MRAVNRQPGYRPGDSPSIQQIWAMEIDCQDSFGQKSDVNENVNDNVNVDGNVDDNVDVNDNVNVNVNVKC